VPMELRKILFSTPELTAALRASGPDAARAFRAGTVERVVVRDDARQTVVFYLATREADSAPVQIIFSRDEVAHALVLYCQQHKIPLPAAGRKVLWPQEEGLALMITLTVITEAEDPRRAPAIYQRQ